MISLNETHDIGLTSWVSSANEPNNDFPIQNLPFAVFRRQGSGEAFRGGVAIGDQVIDLKALNATGLFSGVVAEALQACSSDSLNRFMSMGAEAWSALRLQLSRALREGSEEEASLASCLVPQAEVEYSLPCHIGDYTDFYISVYHATSVGSLFRPDNPLLPNYKWVPIGYHGRSSSIQVSGHEFRRPQGQTKAPDAAEPSFGPCRRLDYELEVGIYIGAGNDLGEPIGLDKADQHVFGLCLFNDWSARDIQAWEYQPLGPFLSKNFASTVSPWIVTLEALAPYQTEWTRDAADPQPLPYLDSETNRASGGMDMALEVYLETDAMRSAGLSAHKLCETNFRHSYWSIGQMVAHHTVNGCNLQPGDFFGSGTQSGPSQEEAGSLLELSRGGKEPISLPNGEVRAFLEDGDSVIMKGFCQRSGAARIGFGEATAKVLPAK
ncbi:fumarylacetoacetase [Marinobacterium mangrovicola]|uniref:fumarylacetoacetase n=1 Tax=Marinobacterium mangrovicola TaxID=1476959 RepID=A0A4R1GQM4_9GAMM|nr:fumarylacetoacetase [Marinobacterium mangrovicola]TCK09315.1 fumarylacetoacetate hydrolase [Marinobacterium mangrovicola]